MPIGNKIYKPLDTQEKLDAYSVEASWANANNAYIEDKGDYYETVSIPAPTTDEKIIEVKAKRRTLLEESDLWMLLDRYEQLTSEQQTELRTYRQALRDVTKQEGFPDEVVFPDKPIWFNPENTVTE